MTDTYPYENPLSHPPDTNHSGVKLTAHLQDVATRTTTVIPKTTTPNNTPLEKLGHICGTLHDFGKLTTYFQQYLAGNRDGDTLTYHSQLGAALTLYVLTETDDYDTTDALIGFTAVAKHHGQLPNVVDDAVGPNGFFERSDHILDQAQNIQTHAPTLAQDILTQTETDIQFTDFVTALEQKTVSKPLTDEFTGIMFASGGNDAPPAAHDALLALWSSLLVADKSSAAGINRDALHTQPFDPNRIQDHIDNLWKHESNWEDAILQLNTKRNQARESAVNTARTLPTDGTVATLTLPTGLGKTFAGTQAALEHLHVKRNDGYPGRLVYALPFTSVIDQTETIFKDVFNTTSTSNELTVHHYRSETVTQHDPDTDSDNFAEREYLLGETWRAGTVLTTYVQLLESLVGPRNQQALKLSSLYGSVILLDEPQSLPSDWWPLFRRLTTVLVNQFDATLILMTATQPRILDDAFSPTELITDTTHYFEEFERVKYTIDNSVFSENQAISPSTAGKRLADEFKTDTQSVLSITNTLNSTSTLFDNTINHLQTTHQPIHIGTQYATHLTTSNSNPVEDTITTITQQSHKTDSPIAVCQLTTNHTPRDRRNLLDIVAHLTETNCPVLLCSTQLVEAGVDISFETVYRDLAPMDSLVQAAGRCNRSFEWNQGTVTVWHLQPDADWKSTPANAVYGRGFNRITRTQETLEQLTPPSHTVSEAKMTTTGVDAYYTRLTQSNPGDDELVQKFDGLQCDDLSDASLIETRDSIDVLVLRTTTDRKQATQLATALENTDYQTAARLKTDLAPLRVSISTPNKTRTQTMKRLPSANPDNPESDLRILDTKQHRGFFDAESGVRIPDQS